MDGINRKIQVLLASIKKSEVYQEYKKQEAYLEKYPELKVRVNRLRADNFRLQNETDRDRLFQASEEILKESAQLRRIPEVNAYLDAELALCKMMQKICRTLTEGIEMEVPDI